MGCGVSVNPGMTKSEKAIKAAILIQRWYRRYLARLEARRMCTWKIFQSIEYHNEQDQLKLYNFFINMMDHTAQSGLTVVEEEPRPKSPLPGLLQDDLTPGYRRLNEQVEDDMTQDYEDISVSPDYTGLRLHFPLTVTQVTKMVEYFREKKALHPRYAIQLLHEARKRLRLMGNINKATTGLLREITICGDLHGSIDDLFVIFYKNGLPSPETPYVFNGDFVDRGPHSVEIALLLFAFLLVYPYEVFLNRGNHEDYIMNLRYGFIKEIITKYKKNASTLVKLFKDIFSWLPLATIIDQRIFVAHGGISDTTDLECIAAVERHKFISALLPPSSDMDHEVHFGLLSGKERTDQEWKQILDLLWSDPRGKLGCGPNTFRGGGSYFGPDVSRKFLEENGLQLIIRSHECKYDGYEFAHNGQVLTIFSASNYYEEGSNRGAYVKIGSDLQPRFVQYMCTAFHTERTMALSQRLSIIETAAIRYLKEKCYANKTALMEAFQEVDPSRTGVITVADWIKAMTAVLNMDLPWRILKNQLVKTPHRNMVYYRSLFETFTVSHRFKQTSFTEALYRCRHELETIFRAMDKDNSGFISMDEFEESCHILSQHINTPMPDDVIHDMAYSMDFNHDGCIDFNEFLEAFRLVDKDFKRTLNVSSVA